MDSPVHRVPLVDGHIDTRKRIVVRDGQSKSLTEQELLVVVALTQAEGRTVSTEDLYAYAWRDRQRTNSRAATFAVLRLRKKIEADPSNPRHLLTVRGSGFRWVDDVSTLPEAAVSQDWFAENTFVGRAELLKKMSQMYEEGETLVSLVGPPGIGKTRLAKEWAQRESQQSSVWFCDLTSCVEGERFTSYVAQALRLVQSDPAQLRSIAETHPRGVLVLDNCETVIDEAAAWVQQARPHLGSIRILVTSQERLGLNEAVVQVPPMSEEEGLQLLQECGSETSDTSLATVRHCDGLPLALELLAHGRQGVPGEGTGDGNALHRAIASSWSRLSQLERQIFAQSSIFTGGFDWLAAEAVFHVNRGDLDPLEPLESLVDKSLLQVHETAYGPRFSLLQNIRLFAAEKRAALDSEDVTMERYLAHFHGRNHGVPSAQLEIDNYVATIRAMCERDQTATITLCLRARRAFRAAGRQSQLWYVMEELSFNLGVEAPELASTFLETRGHQLFCQGRFAASEAALREALTLVDEGTLTHARSLTALGNIHHASNRQEMALALHRQALAVFQTINAFVWSAIALENMALSLCELGRYDEAAVHNKEVRRLYWRFEGSHRYRFHLMSGFIQHGVADIVGAIEAFQEAVAFSQKKSQLDWERVAVVALGSMLMLNGQPGRAREELKRGWGLLPPHEEVETSTLLALRMSQCLFQLNDLDGARKWAQVGAQWAESVHSEHLLASLRLINSMLDGRPVQEILDEPAFQKALAQQLEVRITADLCTLMG